MTPSPRRTSASVVDALYDANVSEMWRGRVVTEDTPHFGSAPIRNRLKGQPPRRRQPSQHPVVAFEQPTMPSPLRVTGRRSNPTDGLLTMELKLVDPIVSSKFPPDQAKPVFRNPPEHDGVSTCCSPPGHAGSQGLPAWLILCDHRADCEVGVVWFTQATPITLKDMPPWLRFRSSTMAWRHPRAA